MNNNPLCQLISPKSIALVGAGNNPRKMGTLHALSIVKDGYQGRFYPIHRQEQMVLGCKAFKSVDDLPEAPELAMLVVPDNQVLQLLADFGKIGTRYALIVTAGFKETGLAGDEKEEQLKEIADRYGIRFLGPNCIGFINSELSLNVTVFPSTGKPGKLGMVSQSGTYITQTLAYLKRKGIHFSKAISVGNEANIDMVDALEYLGQDEQTKAVALYIEGIRNGRRFIEVAQKITRHKPVLAQYVGGSGAGARAGMSHTGAMGGPDFLYEGIFRQAGVIQVFSIEDLYEHGWTLATQPRLRGNRVGVVTNSGGPGTAIAHTCEKGGLEIPRFSENLQQDLKQHLQVHASSANPVDMTFDLDAQTLTRVIPEILMQSGEVDGLILHGAMSHGFMREMYPRLSEMLGGISLEEFLALRQSDLTGTLSLSQRFGLPLLVSSFFGREDNYTAAYRDHDIPVLEAPEKAARAMAALLHYKKIQERKMFVAPQLPAKVPLAVEILKRAVGEGRQMLDEYESKQVLAAYGIAITREKLAFSEEEAVAAAFSLGFPVVLKGCSAEIAHKTEKGLVHLRLMDEKEVRHAFQALSKAVGHSIPALVSEMVPSGRELLAGMARFPGFGPAIMFGLGGIFTEAIRDVTFRCAPLSEAEAEEMLSDILSAKLLGEFRGWPPADTVALSAILATLGNISLLHPEIAEIDLNPLVISGSRPVALDALIVLEQKSKF